MIGVKENVIQCHSEKVNRKKGASMGSNNSDSNKSNENSDNDSDSPRRN